VINASYTDTNVLAQNPFFTLATKITNVYSDAIRKNMEDLTVSSAKVIQEQTIQAWTNAVQSCSKALAENAMSNQQQAIERITEANQKAFGMLAVDLSPFKMQPMATVAHWLPTMTSASFKAPSPNRDESRSPKRERRQRQ
jgi:predicted exporter